MKQSTGVGKAKVPVDTRDRVTGGAYGKPGGSTAGPKAGVPVSSNPHVTGGSYGRMRLK